jgi:hypothetical protein
MILLGETWFSVTLNAAGIVPSANKPFRRAQRQRIDLEPQLIDVLRPNSRSNGRLSCFIIVAQITSSSYGACHPPYSKPPLVFLWTASSLN